MQGLRGLFLIVGSFLIHAAVFTGHFR